MIPLAALFRIAFGLLKQSRELVGFGLLASIAIALLLFAISPQPNFRGKIVGTLLAESSDMHPIPPFHPAVVLILMVNLANRGDPSAAQNYKLVATTPNGEEYIGKDMSIPDSMSGTVGNYKLTLGAADALYTKTIAPIPTGGVVSGILFFISSRNWRKA